MQPSTILDREEYIEQAYFFRLFRERLGENLPAQEILTMADQELLSSTRLPMAVQFLASEMKHSGLLGSGFDRLSHYFHRFQAFLMNESEDEDRKFTTNVALLVLEREAYYRGNQPTPAGLFVFQFETITRNRLNYFRGIDAMLEDPIYDSDWRGFLANVRKQVGTTDFCELIYRRSQWIVLEQKRLHPNYEPNVPILFAEKEGKIAKASRGRDPLFLFAALQRQLGYPEVPKPKKKDEAATQLEMLQHKVREMDARLKLVEAETRGGPIDLQQFMDKPLPTDDE
ncbi:MAG: hypothetical protein R3B84_20265 [Zavarzinella sp.]